MLTDQERAHVQAMNRGRVLGPNRWRNFCCHPMCGKPLEVHAEWLRDKTDLTCDDCRPAIKSGNVMSGAFDPASKQRR